MKIYIRDRRFAETIISVGSWLVEKLLKELVKDQQLAHALAEPPHPYMTVQDFVNWIAQTIEDAATRNQWKPELKKDMLAKLPLIAEAVAHIPQVGQIVRSVLSKDG